MSLHLNVFQFKYILKIVKASSFFRKHILTSIWPGGDGRGGRGDGERRWEGESERQGIVSPGEVKGGGRLSDSVSGRYVTTRYATKRGRPSEDCRMLSMTHRSAGKQAIKIVQNSYQRQKYTLKLAYKWVENLHSISLNKKCISGYGTRWTLLLIFFNYLPTQ